MDSIARKSYDVVVIGAGWAGMNAALVLGRARRNVLVLDGGPPRNSPAESVHGFTTRDGAAIAPLMVTARQELGRYDTVHVAEAEATVVSGERDAFTVSTRGGADVQARRVLLATGITDVLPDVPGVDELWGTSVLHCPYCHGWEVRDEPIAVLGAGDETAYFAADLTRWSADNVLCRHGENQWSDDALGLAAQGQVRVEESPVAAVSAADGEDGTNGVELRFADGRTLWRRAVFVGSGYRQTSDLSEKLGCEILDDGTVAVDDIGQTTVPGVYAAGDMARRRGLPGPVGQVVVAAAAGATAGIAMDAEVALGDLFA